MEFLDSLEFLDSTEFLNSLELLDRLKFVMVWFFMVWFGMNWISMVLYSLISINNQQGYSILGAKRKVDIVYNIIPGRPKYF